MLSNFVTLGGTIVKVFCTGENGLYLVIIGQVLCAIGQVFMASIPTKLVMTWFGPKEVSTACALAIFGTHLGRKYGYVYHT